MTGVETDRGQIQCQYFVNCAGQVEFLLSLFLWLRTCTLSVGRSRYVLSPVKTQLATAVSPLAAGSLVRTGSEWARHQTPDNSASAG